MQRIVETLKKEADILIVVIVGAIFRFKDIVTDDLWYDEAFTGVLMKLPYNDFVTAAANDAHPPLYYFLSRAWTTALGVSDFTLRLLPLIFGLATIYVAYLIGKELFNKETGTIAAFLVAVSPFFVGYSIEARSYSFYGFITALTFYFLIRNKIVAFVAGMAIMLFTHYIAVGFLGAFLLVHLFKKRNDLRGLSKDLILLIPFGVLVLYQIRKMMMQAEQGLNSGWMRDSDLLNIPRSMMAYLLGIKVRLPGADEINNLKFIFNENIWGVALVTGVVVVLAYAGYLFYKTNREGFINLMYLIIGFVLPQALLIGYGLYKGESLYVERYLFPAAVFFMISAAASLNKLFSFEVIGVIVVIYVLLILNIRPHDYYVGMKLLSQELRSEGNEIVFVSPLDFTVAKYYFGVHNKNIRLQEPQNPQETFEWWPLIEAGDYPRDPENALYISADENKMTDEFTKLEITEDLGHYEVYIRNPGTVPTD